MSLTMWKSVGLVCQQPWVERDAFSSGIIIEKGTFGVDHARAVDVEQVEGLFQLGDLVVGDAGALVVAGLECAGFVVGWWGGLSHLL